MESNPGAASHNNSQFLSGGGEMGELIRNFDWPSTAIGAIETWPQSLRTTLSIILNSKFPMFLFWGEYHLCFYNDAYRPSLGNNGKHPAVGQQGEKVWPEIWDAIKPLIDQVLSGGEATWSEDQYLPIYRNGQLEDVYWTFSYSPVYDESGTPAGVFVTCTETTQTVETMRKLQASEQRFKNLVREANVGIVILSGKEMRVSVVNEIYGRLINSTVDEMMNRPLFEIIPQAEAVYRPMLEQVMATGKSIDLFESPYIVTVKGETIHGFVDGVYQPYKELDGTITGVIAIIHDVTETVKARKKTEESEDMLRFAIDAAELATWDLDPSTSTFLGNNRLKEWFGLNVHNEIELSTAVDIIADKDRESVYKAIENAMNFESGGIYDIEYSIIHPKNKSERIVRAKGKAWFNEDKIAYRFNGTIQDVTEQVLSRRLTEEREQLLHLLIDESPIRITFLSGKDMKVVLANDTVLKSWGKDKSVLGLPLREILPELENQEILEKLETIYDTGIPYSAKDAPVTFEVNGELVTSYFDLWYIPLFDAGQVYGILANAVDVTEKKEAQLRMQESELRFRSLVESAPFPIGVYTGKEMKIYLANQTILDIWGKGDDVIGKLYSDILPELENQEVFGQLAGVYETGIPFHAKNTRIDIITDGIQSTFYFNYSFTPLYDAYGKIYGVMNTAADVTDLNVVNHMLEQSEIRFRGLIEESAVAKCLFIGKEMIVEVANERMLKAWGKDKSIIGKPLREAVPELTGQPFLDILDEIYVTGKTYQAINEPAQLLRNGVLETSYFDFTYKPLFDADGNIYGIIDTAIDVTEEVMFRKKIEESEHRFRSMIENAPVAIGLTRGDDMVFDIINKPLLKMIDKTESTIGKPLLEAIPELKDQPILPIIYKVYNTGEPYVGIEVPIALLQNDVSEDRYFNVSYTPMYEKGKVVAILHIATDVTEQVVARKKIEEAQQKARLAIESADLGAYDINLLTDEMKTSDRFKSIWGIDNTTLRADYAERIHPDDRKMRDEAHKESLETGNLHYEARVVWTDGSIHWVRVKGKVIFSENGTPLTLLGVIQDITEQTQFAEQLTRLVNERTQELHRSNEDLLHFAHVASHDLKEPTRKIKFFGNMLENEFKNSLSEKGLFYMGKIQNATDRMFSMIEGVLTYSALRASEQPIEQIDLNEIVENIERDLEVLILQKEGTIKKEHLPLIEGATVLIYQLFYNLINNSLKFSKANTPSRIAITSMVKDNFAAITITDNGIGIEQEYIEQIFNPFARLNAKDQYEGTGLGLALCKKIVERHHGTITASGIRNEGAVFTVMLPLKQTGKLV